MKQKKREIKIKSLVRRLYFFLRYIFTWEKPGFNCLERICSSGLINPVLVHFEGVAIEIVLFWVAH